MSTTVSIRIDLFLICLPPNQNQKIRHNYTASEGQIKGKSEQITAGNAVCVFLLAQKTPPSKSLSGVLIQSQQLLGFYSTSIGYP